MKTLILHHDACLKHDTGPRHPERADRVRAVLKAVGDIEGTEFLPAPTATGEQIFAAHDPAYWKRLNDLEPEQDLLALDADTYLSPGSLEAAMRASGAACFAIDQIMAEKAANAFCATRPPGHHAEHDRAMGFCLLNHVAIAALHALNGHGLERVAILDFDVHHGNGTQHMFEQSPEVLYVSSHQAPLFPGGGSADEKGVGNIVNLPLEAGTGGDGFRFVWVNSGISAVERFAPELILVSAGFDGHAADPLAQMELQDDDYGWITREICRIADRFCSGRIVSVLEGGYDLVALGDCARAHVGALTSG